MRMKVKKREEETLGAPPILLPPSEPSHRLAHSDALPHCSSIILRCLFCTLHPKSNPNWEEGGNPFDSNSNCDEWDALDDLGTQFKELERWQRRKRM
jgi:hypothetical protein